MGRTEKAGAGSAALDRFVDRLGLASESEGLPRIAGRLMAFLLAEEGAHSAADLAAALQVSRGSVSTNVRLLERLGIVERTTRPGDRQAYYRIADDSPRRLLEGQLGRMRALERIVTESLGELRAAGRRGTHLEELRRFYRSAIRQTERVLEEWREGRSAS